MDDVVEIPEPFRESLNLDAEPLDEVMNTEETAQRAKHSSVSSTARITIDPRTPFGFFQRDPDSIRSVTVVDAGVADFDRVLAHVYTLGSLCRCTELRFLRCENPNDLLVRLLRSGTFVSLERVRCESLPLDPESVAREVDKYSHICRRSPRRELLRIELVHPGPSATVHTTRQIECVNMTNDIEVEDYVSIVSSFF